MAMESPDCAEKDPPLNSEYEESNESVWIELVEFFRDAIGDKLSEEEYRYTAPDKVERNYWIYIVEVILGVDKNIASLQRCHVDDNEPESPEEDENESERANRQAEELLREEEEARNASQQKISSSKTLKKKRKKQKAKQGKEGKTDEGGRDEEEKDERYAGEKDNVNEEERDIGYDGEGDGDHEAERVNNEEEKDERNEGRKVNVNEEERAIGYEGKRVKVHEKLAVQYEGGKVNGYKGKKVNGYEGDDGHKHFYKKVGRKQYKGKESCSADGRQKDPKKEDENSLPEFTADEESIYLSHKAEENEQIAFVGDGRDIYSNENTMPGKNVDGVEKPKELRQSEENTVPEENANSGQHIETNEKSEEPKQATEGIFPKENVFVAQSKETVRQINEPEQTPGNKISREKDKQTHEPKQARNVDKVQGKKRVEKSKKLKQQARNVNFNEVRDTKRVEKSERLKQQTEEPNQATNGKFYEGNASEARATEFVTIIEESEQAKKNIISRERVPETLEIEYVKQIQQPKQARNVDEVQDKKRVKKSKRLNQQTKELNQATGSIFSKGNVSEAQDPEIVRQAKEPKQDPENIISTERVPETLETDPKQAKNLDEVQDKNKSKSQQKPRASTTSVPVGIRNLGNTCYMNAAFQFLLRPMGYKWLDLDKRGAPDTDLSKEFHKLWDLLLSNNGGSTIEPESTKCIQSAWNQFKHPNNGGSTFEPTQQEDAEEFMTFIFTHLLNGLLCANAFQVKYIKESCCRLCPNTEVIHNHQYPYLRLGFRDNGRGAFDLTEFLVNKFQNSVCSEYFCGRCGGNYMGNYNRFISTSEFLIICLPRTTKLNEVGNWKRQYKFQNIPHDLDLKPYFTRGNNVPEDHTRYKLRAVLTHMGQSMDSGHYIAAVLDTTTGTWFKFDDDHVTKLVDFQRQVGDDAYMLLFRNLAREK